jgi:hypothetical protein
LPKAGIGRFTVRPGSRTDHSLYVAVAVDTLCLVAARKGLGGQQGTEIGICSAGQC